MTTISVATLPRVATDRSAVSLFASLGVGVLIVAVPFETVQPLLSLPGQSVTSAELVVIAVVAGWIAACLRASEWPHWRTALTSAWLALLAASLVAAALAPSFAANALHMTGRLALAFIVYLLTVNGVTSWERLRLVSFTAAATGLLLGAIVLLDAADAGPLRRWLTAFRPFVAHVGAQVRASGPFQYPTIASMYLEVLFAWSLPLAALAIEHGRRSRALAATAVFLVMAQASVATFTRAGLVTMLASIAVVGACRYRARGADAVVRWFGVLAILMVVQFAASRSLEPLWLRLTTEGTDAWYSAEIDAPARIAMPTGGMQRVTLTVKNDGRVTWDSHAAQPFRLSYHWLTADGMRVVSWEGRRTLFPHPVPPGSELTLVAEIGAPRQPGEYRVLWDIEHEHRLWFSTEPGAEPAVSVAHVSGQALGALPPLTPLPRPLQDGAFRPGRRALWSAAARMIRERPLTGIGPDNFRLRYGPYLRIADADARLHSNNMYIEVLAGTGLLGGAALAYFTWRVGVTAFRALGSIRRRRDEWPEDAIGRSLLVSGVAAGVTAIAVHGLVDSFLSFTATYVLIAVALGLLASLEFLSRPHADRL